MNKLLKWAALTLATLFGCGWVLVSCSQAMYERRRVLEEALADFSWIVLSLLLVGLFASVLWSLLRGNDD